LDRKGDGRKGKTCRRYHDEGIPCQHMICVYRHYLTMTDPVSSKSSFPPILLSSVHPTTLVQPQNYVKGPGVLQRLRFESVGERLTQGNVSRLVSQAPRSRPEPDEDSDEGGDNVDVDDV